MAADAPLRRYAPAFLGLMSNRLIDRIVEEGGRYAETSGVRAPVRFMSSLLLLADREQSVTELARALGMTHAGAIKAVQTLEKEGLAVRRDDPCDGRRKIIGLTEQGRSAAQEADAFMKRARAAYQTLFEEIGVDLYAAITAANAALDRADFGARLAAADPAKGRVQI